MSINLVAFHSISRIGGTAPFTLARCLNQPQKAGSERTVDTEMCKSPKRRNRQPMMGSPLLMPDELPNWLLLMQLKADWRLRLDWRRGLCREEFQTGLSIPQAFPQADCRRRLGRKPKFLGYLPEEACRKYCIKMLTLPAPNRRLPLSRIWCSFSKTPTEFFR